MAISDKITSMTNHLTADYDAIESVVGEVTVDKNIENIAPLINNLYEELPKVTASGTELTINDTRAGKMEVQPMGNTSQTQKTGKNLLNIQTSSSSQFGITVTKNSDGTLTVNGTATADAAVIFNTTVTLAAGTYTLSGCPSGGSSSTYNLNLDQLSTMRDNGSGVTFTLNAERTSTAYVSVKSGVTLNNVIFKPMIVSGSTSGDFEPYTGKKATPNPDNPEQVHTCSGDNEIVVCGKNLFDKTRIISGKRLDNKGLPSISDNYCTTDYFIAVEPNTTYYSTSVINQAKAVCFYDSNQNFIERVMYLNLNTFTTGSTTHYIKMSILLSEIDMQQLEKGSIATTYEPYQSSTYPIHLGTYELCKIGTYQDKFIRNSGKNLFNETNKLAGYYFENNGTIMSDGGPRNVLYYFKCKPSTAYSFSYSSYKNVSIINITTTTETPQANVSVGDGSSITLANLKKENYITPSNAEYIVIRFQSATGYYIATGEFADFITDFQAEENASATTYEPYGNGDWYLEKHIGKYQCTGEENWQVYNNRDVYAPNLFSTASSSSSSINGYCNYCSTNNNTYMEFTSSKNGLSFNRVVENWGLSEASKSALNTYLSSNNVEVYYVLNTPTYTKIEGTLAEQLEDVWRTYSYKGQTNISQINNDLPFELSVTALEG